MMRKETIAFEMKNIFQRKLLVKLKYMEEYLKRMKMNPSSDAVFGVRTKRQVWVVQKNSKYLIKFSCKKERACTLYFPYSFLVRWSLYCGGPN